MSRLGKKPITIPEGVQVQIEDHQVTIRGPKGVLARPISEDIKVKVDGDQMIVELVSDKRTAEAVYGLTRALLANMVEGVTKGFHKELDVVGVGYRAQKAGDKLILQVGFSRPVELAIVSGVGVDIQEVRLSERETVSRIRVSGIDKELVGQFAAKIRDVKRPDSYKGKGIRYVGVQMKLKPGKAGKIVKK